MIAKNLRTLLFLLLFLLAATPAFSWWGFPLQGNGAWVTQGALKNPLIYSDHFDWIVTKGQFINPQMTKPIVLNVGADSCNLNAFQAQVDKHHSQVVAVVWDYECGHPQDLAEWNLSQAKWYVNSYGLPFGVAVVQESSNSLIHNGVSYERAWLFSDFLMPMIYCQWWYNYPPYTRENWRVSSSQASVPAIPIVNLQPSQAPIRTPILIEELFRNYYDLEPAPSAMAWYSLKPLNEPYLWAIEFIGP